MKATMEKDCSNSYVIELENGMRFSVMKEDCEEFFHDEEDVLRKFVEERG